MSAFDASAALRVRFRHLQIADQETEWHPQLRRLLERYSSGQRVDFDAIELHLPDRTPFQQEVLRVTRELPYGTTVTYGQLAELAGRPRAARAVGTIMSTNRFPVIIPCHRVLAAGGCLGGYSAPQGLTLKARLLELERS